jgi:dihydrofolate reductase
MPDLKATVFIATSLDGFIARPDGAIDWLPTGADTKFEDYGYAELMKSVDALVMGRKTFETVRGFGGEWPYGTKPVIVLSSKKVEIPKELSKSVTYMSGNINAIREILATRDVKHIYVDGGVTIQRFINAGAIDRLIITRIPVLIGEGIPLFGKLENGDVHLAHIGTKSYPSGLVQSEYTVASWKKKQAVPAAPAKRRSTRKSRITKTIKAKKRS